jgi:hypothetical protein
MRVDERLPVPDDKSRELSARAPSLAGFVETPTAERRAGSTNLTVADPIVALKSVEVPDERSFRDIQAASAVTEVKNIEGKLSFADGKVR